MICKHFGECGACRVFENGYDAQLASKLKLVEEQFSHLYSKEFFVATSPNEHYRSRSEFKIWHLEDDIFYAMNNIDKNGVVLIEECPQVNEHIASLMSKLLGEIKEAKIAEKLFGVDFLSSSDGEIVVSLLYHKHLDHIWKEQATLIAKKLDISIIGRSRGQKEIIGKDFVIERYLIKGEVYSSKHIENSFTQPNARVNEKMIEWSLNQVKTIDGDLLELYCGAGNFTIPFAKHFRSVLATEISKSSIYAAQENMRLNGVENINFVRMSVEEFTQALDGVREFNRMKHIKLQNYELKTIFVDPPRSGMDPNSCEFASRYQHIVYISCNPQTLLRDLETLTQTHEIEAMAVFDQFPYTHHLEMGVKLLRKD